MGFLNTMMDTARGAAKWVGSQAGAELSPHMSTLFTQGGKSTGTGFLETGAAQGVAQHLGFAAMGSAIGGASAYATGGDVKTGMGMGAMGGAMGAHFTPELRDLARTGAMGLARHNAEEAKAAWNVAKKGGTATVETMKGLTDNVINAQVASHAVHAATDNNWRAAAVAGGAGLASGVVFSGHKRKPMNRYNANRGNYIGGR